MKKLAFLDTETTDLDERTGDMWEIFLILREPGRDDCGFWYQVRPDLAQASPASVQIGRYYERSRVTTVNMGMGKILCTSAEAPEGAAWIKRYTGNPPAPGDYYMDRSAAAIAAQLARRLDGATIVANNPAFDRKFLEKFLRGHGQILTAHHRMINVRDLLIGYIDGRLAAYDGKVEDAFEPTAVPYVEDWLVGAADSPAWEIVGVAEDPATKHTALGDARLVRDVYDAIRGARR
ncbi:hypothetical protein HNP84_010267 [Thermocatellispora tengchongensis]|uniref:Exonuclease n=1 Tax=Thermocatellispora tengchongensis TaxID=1073253 RepID=A0A840PNJ0_9ACTN|nr:hypothetical protein [Thermocatellispora tengchongensis]MBB5140499.1 hypothetical protein [Thermocatellispora tengchongensis]